MKKETDNWALEGPGLVTSDSGTQWPFPKEAELASMHFYFCWSLLLFVLAFESPTADRPLPSSWALGLQKTQFSIAARKSRAHLSGHGRCECRVIKQCRKGVRVHLCVCVWVCMHVYKYVCGGEVE